MSRASSASKSGPIDAKPAAANKVRINVIYYSLHGHIATSKFTLFYIKTID